MVEKLKTVRSINPMPKAQNRPNADRPGCYDLVFRRPRTEVIPGEETEIDIYITGYGSASGVKLYFMPPTSFVEAGSCRVEHSIGQKDDGLAHFGSLHEQGGDDGMTLDLSSGGLEQAGWGGPSLFFDLGYAAIATEQSTPEPPVKIRLKVKKKVATGDHSLSFALTYFNGQEWRMAYRTAVLHVRTLYERYEGQAWIAGILIAVFAMIASVVAAVASIIAIGSASGTG